MEALVPAQALLAAIKLAPAVGILLDKIVDSNNKKMELEAEEKRQIIISTTQLIQSQHHCVQVAGKFIKDIVNDAGDHSKTVAILKELREMEDLPPKEKAEIIDKTLKQDHELRKEGLSAIQKLGTTAIVGGTAVAIGFVAKEIVKYVTRKKSIPELVADTLQQWIKRKKR